MKTRILFLLGVVTLLGCDRNPSYDSDAPKSGATPGDATNLSTNMPPKVNAPPTNATPPAAPPPAIP